VPPVRISTLLNRSAFVKAASSRGARDASLVRMAIGQHGGVRGGLLRQARQAQQSEAGQIPLPRLITTIPPTYGL
jgi:hypothetical protein